MRHRTTRRLLALALALGVGGAGPAAAEEPDPEDVDREFHRAPARGEATGPDADLFWEGVRLQEEGKYRSARRKFWTLVDEYPESPFAAEAEDRSGDRGGGNAFLGYTPMHDLGPVDRRIDVALMGDGYLLDKQDRFDKHADGHLKVLMGEPVYEEYAPYFNFYRFNLASAETGVDEVERAPPDEELEERKKKRKRKPPKLRTFVTALDCSAAGPQGQVMANAGRVWHYLSYLKENDGLAICFAQKGQLGMGGMGIATTGPRGVVVHEFGHAFPGLLDEYAVNPGEPRMVFEAANATTHPDAPPWKHFLDAKVPGVGVYEGGATFQKGVWRPAPSCAMNVGGSQYCPVCREAAVLTIYTYVSPIDDAWPAEEVVRPGEKGAWPDVAVVPMRPASHELEVEWWLGPEPAVTGGTGAKPPDPAGADEEEDAGEEEEDPDEDPFARRLRKRLGRRTGGLEPTLPFRPGSLRRDAGTANDAQPPGRLLEVEKQKRKEGGTAYRPSLPPGLAPGRHVLTAVVRDTTRMRGQKHPWVLKDERGLLEDRARWILEVPEAR